MHRATPTRTAPSWLLALCCAAAVAACSSSEPSEPSESGDDVTTTSTPTTAPIPEPGGQSVSTLDLCERFDGEAQAFLTSVEADPVVEQQGDASEVASVCAWFVEETDVERPANLLLRVEPVRVEGNFLCEDRDELNTEPLDSGDAPNGWISTTAPVEAAIEGQAWCVYARAPETIQPGDVTTAAMAALLADMDALLPS